MGKHIFMVGVFPPPVHGMSEVNQALYNYLTTDGLVIEKLDTAPKTLRRDLLSRLSRLRKFFKVWFCLIRIHNKQGILYMSLSGEWGQLYDLVCLMIARIKNFQCFLHHHSYAYLQKRNALFALLIRVAGENVIHVVLSAEMGRLMKTQYGVSNKIVVLSNLAFSQPDCHPQPHTRVQKIGYLSNITKSKGGEIILGLANEIKHKSIPIDIVIAGPCPEDDLAQKLRNAMSASILEWRGGVYGNQKSSFFNEIDIFVFPTQYQNEAEPLVIWETLAAGIPVISYERGSISEQVGKAGELIPAEEDFIPRALNILERWVANPEEYQQYVQHAQEHFQNKKAQSEQQWHDLENVLIALSNGDE